MRHPTNQRHFLLKFNFEAPSAHQPVAGFTRDPFLMTQSSNDRLPDIITQATLDYFYK
jgi:hypothetical protein